ncbi:4Fe-4S dicluster domain-containing protein [Trueperella pyogenes]|uniref:ferredoxin family protein n=1 Tax=Trueperella pyogenes TaxID=1661 RepID=UPI00057CC6E1|nr:4Fe-4S dicluster domain-containing protein [Trueperella pyogenes]AJC69303.1 ferredoxin [Trueperella pyogenes TP8]AZR00726.1 ferredoxin [Trueperella pyogenes]MBB3024286.1 ferredoxin like protein [Trueperella pyogenes]MDF2420746.1 4Fe-4S dicluster domain-containing protein [Trueperella pyogenes]WHU56387.1 4Fe-4S dicluster domain-containing protein [Trueperella pyogenes]
MTKFIPGSINDRLARNVYDIDEGNPHIVIHQERVRATGAAKILVNVCPAHVYSEENGEVMAEYAACLECGTCLAVAPPGTLTWRYPAGSMGIAYREG